MKGKDHATPKVHRLIAALEKSDEGSVELRGYLGTSDESVVRLYRTVDTSSYVEIPKEDILYLEGPEGGELGEVRAFVKSSSLLRDVHIDQVAAFDVVVGTWPDYWSCAGPCESEFARAAFEIELLRSQEEFAEAAVRESGARGVLSACLNECLDSAKRKPLWLRVEDASPHGYHLEPFSVPRHERLIVEKHLRRSA